MTLTVALLVCVVAAGTFAAGWYASERRFTEPVDVPLKCDGVPPAWPPFMPQ